MLPNDPGPAPLAFTMRVRPDPGGKVRGDPVTNPALLGATPTFRIADLDITGRLLPDGTPAIPGGQVIALIDLLGRPEGIAKLDLSELQRLEDWITASRATPNRD